MFCKRRNNKKDDKHHDRNGVPHQQPESEKTRKNRIYTHLHFFLQFIYNERQRGSVGLPIRTEQILAILLRRQAVRSGVDM
jgi:hypothetical protein